MFWIMKDLRIRITHNFRGRLASIRARCPSVAIIRPSLISRRIRLRRTMRNQGFLIILHQSFATVLAIALGGCC